MALPPFVCLYCLPCMHAISLFCNITIFVLKLLTEECEIYTTHTFTLFIRKRLVAVLWILIYTLLPCTQTVTKPGREQMQCKTSTRGKSCRENFLAFQQFIGKLSVLYCFSQREVFRILILKFFRVKPHVCSVLSVTRACFEKMGSGIKVSPSAVQCVRILC